MCIMKRKVSVTTGLWRVWGGSDEGGGTPGNGSPRGGVAKVVILGLKAVVALIELADGRCARAFAQIAPPTMRCSSSGGWAPPSASTTTARS